MKKTSTIHSYFFILIFSITSFTSGLQADHNTSIDIAYNSISKKVLHWSEYLDIRISSWLDDNVSYEECQAQEINHIKNENTQKKYDINYFFQNNKYLNETKDIYVRLRLNNYLYSREKNRMNVRLNAQLPFDRCKAQWKFFLQDSTNSLSEVKSTDTSNGGVGIRYYQEALYGVSASYSLGLSGGSPYLRGRYKFPIKYHDWKIEPVQIFKYSTKYYFEEETNIYFDKYLNENDLFRIQLHRKSGSTLEGTDYGIIFRYYLNLGKDSGLELSQSFFGNTHYSHYYALDESYNNINNYVTSISWRENLWRKWFYYEIRPTVNFHKDYNYKPSYSLRFLFDIYFGEYN